MVNVKRAELILQSSKRMLKRRMVKGFHYGADRERERELVLLCMCV